jgi:hypothetical protein
VRDPAKGVAEMTRLVRPGGMVAAYAWDILGGGFTLEPLRIELRAMGIKPVDPPSVEIPSSPSERLMVQLCNLLAL